MFYPPASHILSLQHWKTWKLKLLFLLTKITCHNKKATLSLIFSDNEIDYTSNPYYSKINLQENTILSLIQSADKKELNEHRFAIIHPYV